MPPRIFISYRRDDAAGDAGRLSDHLHRRFGATGIFLDIEAIEPGTDFVRALHASLNQTAAMLVVIGPRWTSLCAADGTRRLDDPNDFVRLEVETALTRDIRVVPVLVQGAAIPRKEDLPASLAALATRQVVSLDHAEFHDDAERLCDHLATLIGGGESTGWSRIPRWWPVAAVIAVLALAAGAYGLMRIDRAGTPTSTNPPATGVNRTAVPPAVVPGVDALLAEASTQRRRGQLVEALATLTRARALAPSSEAVQRTQEDVAMEWIRSVRVEDGKSTFSDAIKPGLAVIDAALASAQGARRADLLAHSGWASFLMWRDGNRRLDPAEWYREALSLDPQNPYANAMLAHWVLLEKDDVAGAVKLFDTALRTGRATDAIRVLQWGGYGNSNTRAANAQRVRLADAMRRNGERLNVRQAQALWAPYYFSLPASRDEDRQALIDALPADDHISTLDWAFEEYAAKDESRLRTIRYYVALLHANSGRRDLAANELRTLNKELATSSGSLRDAVQAALQRLQAGRGARPLP